MEKAVIDRFEENKAVLLVGNDQSLLVVERSALPQEAKEGDWFRITVVEGQLKEITPDHEESENRRQSIVEKLEKLRRGEHLK